MIRRRIAEEEIGTIPIAAFFLDEEEPLVVALWV